MMKKLFSIAILLLLTVTCQQVMAKKYGHGPYKGPTHPSNLKSLNRYKKMNFNKMDALTLSRSIQGLDLANAQAIIAYRERYGQFKSFDDLLKVKGITSAFLSSHKRLLEDLFSL